MSITVALSVLQAAADAIRSHPDLESASVESDHTSGEIMFTVRDGSAYVLRLQALSDDEED